jgi:hypothetical protein
MREDPQYREDMARRQKEYYNKNKEKHLDTVKKCYQANKDKIYEHIKEKRGQDKINSVVSKLENMSMEELAKILIEARYYSDSRRYLPFFRGSPMNRQPSAVV